MLALEHLKSLISCKIDAFCTAGIVVQKYLDGSVSATICDTHYGHAKNLGHLRVPQSVRTSIAHKLSQGIPPDRIVKDIGECVDTSFNRVHMINKKDVANIECAFGLKVPVQRHPDDAISTKLWVEELKSKGKANPVLFYKQQGNSCHGFNDEDFVLILQTPLQSLLLQKFGTNIVCIDSTYKITGYDFVLITVLVVDEFGEGYPVSWCLANREDEVVMKKFYSCLREKADKDIKPKWIMTDDAEQFYSSWVSVFGHTPHKLLCTWHVQRAWRANLSKVVSKEAKTRVYHIIMTLLEETDVDKFNCSLDNFVSQMTAEEATKEYGEYFKKYYYARKEQWASCYRLHSGINTNMYVEAFHRVLKYIYFKGKVNKRVDKCAQILLEFARDKAFERLIKLEKGKPSLRASTIHKRYQESIKMSFAQIECLTANTWKVQSSYDPDTFYEVLQEETCCSADKSCLRCNTCNICIHQFVCGCPDSLYRSTICKHIHLIARSLNDTTSRSNLSLLECTGNIEHEPILKEVQQPSQESSIPVIKQHLFQKMSALSTCLNNCHDMQILKAVSSHLSSALNILNMEGNQVPLPSSNTPVNKKVEPQQKFVSTHKRKKQSTTKIAAPTYSQKHYYKQALTCNKPLFVDESQSITG